jgi:crotonobetainyl-CoA:carnitine CoA-transferase CaiB-like acyl-CoA transferase
MTRPLSGLKVLDLSRYIAGPHCATVLGDLGADVVKVERPKMGDDTRSFAPEIGGESIYFLMFNRSKRGITLDFRNQEAQALLRRLVGQADVLIENFRPGTMERMGCGWDELRAVNPRLIMARISGYGQTTSLANQPCFDGIAQATSGLMDLTGSPDGSPMLAGTFVVDYSTALYACIGILAALEQRHATGEGQMVDVSLMGSATSLLMTAIPEYVVKGTQLTRSGNRDRYTAPANTFQAKDGPWVHVIAGGDPLFKRFVRMIGRPELLEDPRFSTLAARMQNVEAAEAIVAEWVGSLIADEVVMRLSEAELPSAKVATIKDVVENSYLREAANIIDVEHPTAGTVPMSGPVIKVGSEAPPVAPAPLLGQHTEEVLAEWLQLSAAEIADLKIARVV